MMRLPGLSAMARPALKALLCLAVAVQAGELTFLGSGFLDGLTCSGAALGEDFELM